ncbi:MAG: TetR/AcrR family transcriptional regulator [Candidatus Tectomicrobia bacterium]|uniref:TetR/AcrR family transcriptional regulator n=1 Tax=Tectimicrobiota bacterium TaxID=2528274 RepID=A0A933GPP4_UNCTE|nr:TetR/AcrR family transcriptional regulator [Candidatus Tectomicrobia bacterium]
MRTKGEETKDKIIRTARRLFKYQGYKNTTIDDISNASGIKRGNIYFYFASKEEIAYAAVNNALQSEFPFLEKIMGEEKNPITKIKLMIDGMAEHILERECRGG